MEISAQSLSHHFKIPKPLTSFSALPPPLFHSKPSFPASNSVSFQSSKGQLRGVGGIKASQNWRNNVGVILHASRAESPATATATATATDIAERWLLQPVGDGDSKHIGFKVKMPDAFEISSNEVTVGRLPDKVDLVIPVATVSGVHALIQKKEGNLLVTDLDSTNGTYIDDKRLKPGVVATVPPGSLITFGDTHLAIFRVSKLEIVEAASKPEESEDKQETDSQTDNSETSSN